MSELDVILRESLGRLAEPGDPTGVADAIMARVGAAGSGGDAPGAGPAGDGGSGAAGGATGGGGFLGGWGLFAVVGLVALVGGAGLALAQTSDASTSATEYAPLSLPADHGVPAAACPGGATVALLDQGARVVAVARTEDGTAVAVRDPRHLDSLVWISLSAAEPDAGSDIDALPVSGCEESGPIVPIVTESAPEPVPTETTEAPGPQPDPGPQQPGDTTVPSMQVGNFSPSKIWSADEVCGVEDSALVTVIASDPSGIANVSWSANHSPSTVTLQSQSGSSYVYRYQGIYPGTQPDKTVTVTFTATDGAGNSKSLAASLTLGSADTCLF